MSVLPSPVPHPLDYCPWDLPGWAYEALEWVVGFQWPDGNEAETWDVADRWYALAGALAGPRDDAGSAAGRFVSGYGGSGVTAEAFTAAWTGASDDLDALLAISHELGRLVEECGCDIEGAKIEAWIELGIFVVELIGMAVAVALTLGAASPAAGGLIAATRIAIQQIFRKLVAQLSSKAVKQSLRGAVTKAGLRTLGRDALRQGVAEAGEEFAVNAAIQGYQNSTGRRDGLDLDELRMSTAGGFAGGFASAGAGIGRGPGPDGVLRGAGGEVLGELGGAAVSGQLDLEGLAKSATSGAAGSVVRGVEAGFDGLQVPVADLSTPPAPVPSGTSTVDGFGSSAGPELGHPSATAPSQSVASFAGSPEPSAAGSGSPAGVSAGSAQLPAEPPRPVPTPIAEPSSPVDLAAATSSATSPQPSDHPEPDMSVSAPARNDLSLSALAPPNETPVAPPPVGSAPSNADPALSGPAVAGVAPPEPTPMPSAPAGPGHAPHTNDQPVAAPGNTVPPRSAPVYYSSTYQHSERSPDPLASLAPAPGRAAAPPAGDQAVTSPSAGGTAVTSPSAGGTAAISPSAGGTAATSPPAGGTAAISPPDVDPRRARADRIAQALSGGLPRPRPPAPPRSAPDPDATARTAYFRFAAHARRVHEENRRSEYADFLTAVADTHRAHAVQLGDRASAAERDGLTLRAESCRTGAREAAEEAIALSDRALRVQAGEIVPDRVDVHGADWRRINHDVGDLAPGGVTTGDGSALAGDDVAPPVDRSRRYGTRGGLRPPLAVHQHELERAMPRDGDGRVRRLADPRSGGWFALANDGGPQADPTRGINCLDGVLSLFDTYVHGRPRVSAPRTFDAYAHGDPNRPLGAEEGGLARIQDAAGGEFQGMCPYVGSLPPAQAQQAVDTAMTNLANHLHNVGHGAFAFIVTDSEGGTAHAWAAVNQNGTILFLDPQTRRISEETPLYRHHGRPYEGNVVSMDALVVDGRGEWSSIPYHEPGLWSRSALEATGSDAQSSDEDADPDGHEASAPDGSIPDGPEGDPAEGREDRPVEDGAALAGGSEGGAAERGDAAGDARGGGPDGVEAGPTPPVAKTPAQLEEERLLQTLSTSERTMLDRAIAEAVDIAERALRDMRDVAASVEHPHDEIPPTVEDVKHRVKTLPSLTRKFKEREATAGISLSDFLGQANDRVRFTMVVGERGYGATVRDALRLLEDRGYSVTEITSFWGDGRGRHNGLNVVLTSPDQFRMELQFPTPASRDVGKETHHRYEDVRLDTMPARTRIEAFLAILRINKRADMANRQPHDLDQLPEFVSVDTSFVTWASGKGALPWTAYRDSLFHGNKRFSDVLREFDLSLSDIPGFERLGLRDEPSASGIPRLQNDGGGASHKPGGLHDDDGRATPGGDVARQPEGMDVRPRTGGSPTLRRHVSGSIDRGRPEDGGASGSGVSGDGVAERGNDPGDVRGGSPERLDLRPSADLTPDQAETVQVDDALVAINERPGQTLGALGPEFQRGVHYPELLEHEHELDQAEHLGRQFDLRALDALHGRTDGLGNPDVLVRADEADAGAYADLKRLFGTEQPTPRDPDYSRRVEKRLRDAFSQDRRITTALVDGRDVGLTIDGAVRGIRRALGFWRQAGRDVSPEQRMIVVTGDGTFVTWRGDTGAINVSA